MVIQMNTCPIKHDTTKTAIVNYCFTFLSKALLEQWWRKMLF